MTSLGAAQSSTSGGRKRAKVEVTSSKPALECKLRLDLQALYEDGLLSDVHLHVRGDGAQAAKTFSCHRAILAAASTYFKAIFTSNCKENGKSEVTLNDVDPHVFEDIIRLCYGGPVTLDRANVVGLMQAAEFYGVSELRESCTAFFQQGLSAEVYYELLDLGMTIRCERAQQLCIRALAKDFATAISHPAFLTVSVDSLRGMLQDDALSVPSEEAVLQALVTWLEHNKSGMLEREIPAREIDELLLLVRWPWLPTSVLCAVQERYPCLSSCAMLDRLLLQAFRFHASSAEQRSALGCESVQFQPRPGMLRLSELLPDGLMTDMTFVWNVPNFASIEQESLYSPHVCVNGNRWSIYMWPRRRCSSQTGKEQDWVSIYLNSVDVKNGDVEQLPTYAFELTVKNYLDAGRSITREYEHAFDSQAVDWGLSRFVSYAQVCDPFQGFLNGGTLTIICAIHQMTDEDEVRGQRVPVRCFACARLPMCTSN